MSETVNIIWGKSEHVIDVEAPMLKDLETFKETLLPMINNNRRASEMDELTGEEEIINCYLDLLNERKHAKAD